MKSLVDKNPGDVDGRTPPYNAARNGHLEIYNLICEHTNDKNPSDALGQTPISIANNFKKLEIVAFLEKMNNDQKLL